MRWGTFWRVLGLGLLAIGAWGQDDLEDPGTLAQKQYKVSISGTTVELTCSLDDDSIKWEKNDKILTNEENQNLILENFSEVEDSGYYACYTDPKGEKNYLYLRAKVCENCVEVDLTTMAVIIIADILITLGLLMMVYYWSKKRKSSAKPVTRGTGTGGRPRGKNKDRPPPVPNPDYEPIRKGQRDLYSGLNQRAI